MSLAPLVRSGNSRPMTFRALVLVAPLLLGGCLSAMASSQDTSRVRLGQTASVGLVHVTPRQVIEDSRCARGTQCVWAGQLRVRSTIDTPGGQHERTLTLGKPEQIGGGTLLLQAVTPAPVADQPIPPRDYSFTFHYTMPSAR
jgi:hypothetical protein